MVATPPKSSNEPLGGDSGAGTALLPPEAPDTVGDALTALHACLQRADVFYGHGTDNAWDEAVLLLMCACAMPVDADEHVLDLPMDSAAWSVACVWIERRVRERVPLPYLVGRAWFAGIEFKCDERALVPRSPLGELIRNDYAPWWVGDAPRRLLDLCCGGGCIGIAAAIYLPELEVVLADIDRDALSLAQENIALHDVSARVATQESDVLAALRDQRFDIILSNPPYVDSPDLASMPPEYHAEPPLGLGSGEDGLDITRRILRGAQAHLNPGGLLFVELGNSWEALDHALAGFPLTWIEFSEGGHGVLVLRAEELEAVVGHLDG